MTPQPDDLSTYAEDARLSPEESGNILAAISACVRELLSAQEDVAAAEALLRAAQDRERNLVENQLPLLMDEARQKQLVTLDGYQVTRGEVVRASVSAENMPAAVEWLQANGAGSLIKRELKLAFGKGEEQRAAEAVDVLREHSFAPQDKLSVHPQTLSALVREKLAEGIELPMSLLGIYVQPLCKIKHVG